VTIAAGKDYGLALRTDGTILSWGNNQFGQLGNGGTSPYVATPTIIPGLSNVVAIAAGFWTSMAIKSDGTVVAWGYNQDGEVGIGTFTTAVPTPTPVPGLSGITAVAVGGGFMGALKSDGTVWEWGDNTLGQLGTVSPPNTCCFATAQPVPGVIGVSALVLGSDHTIAVRSDGSVWTWGRNADGELGNGSLPTSGCFCVPTPAPVPGMSGVVAAAAALNSSLVVKGDGSVWTWGRGFQGALGTGNMNSVPTPAQVPGVSNARGATGFVSGFSYLALLSSGEVVGWGVSGSGELLNNSQTPAITPTPTPATGIPRGQSVAVAMGDRWSMALQTDGTVWSAGLNRYGQLGQGFPTAYDPSTCTCVPTAARSVVTTGGGLVAITLRHINPDPSGDAYYVNTFTPGQAQQFAVVITGSMSSAYFYVDQLQQQSVLSGGTITWTPPTNPGGSFKVHTFFVQGTDLAGNPVSSQPLALYALVQVAGDAVSILPTGAVEFNPFEADLLDVTCLDKLPGTPACVGQPPAAPALFRQVHGGILRGKSNGTSFVEPPQFLRSADPGTSFYCDSLGSMAAIRTNTQSGPFSDGAFTSYLSTYETRVNLTIPEVFAVPTPPGTTGPTNQSPFVPWIFSSIYLAISPAGQTTVQWGDATGHTNLGNSLFPYHYLYKDKVLQDQKPHPTPDLARWTTTADLSLTRIYEAIKLGLGPTIPGPVIDHFVAGQNLDMVAARFLFAGERAECARQRFAAYYQNRTPNLETYLQNHFPGFDLLDKWFLLGRMYKPNILPHFTPWEVTQGVTQANFARDYSCLVAGCPGLEHDKAIGVFSPVSVDVYDGSGRHVGPLPDGTIEQGIPSVTYVTFGHATFLLLPNDPAYRVKLTGTGDGLATFNASDYDSQSRLDFAQYNNVPVTSNSTGTLTMGQVGTPLSWDANGSGNVSHLTPSTATTSQAPDSTDVTPPTTTVTVQGTSGQPGFYRTPVDVSFVGHDDLTGVVQTNYSLNGGTTWTLYTAPLHLGSDGVYQVLFRSTDYASNQEQARSVSFVIDTVPPTVSIVAPTAGPYTLAQPVAASYSCADIGSGVATCSGTVGNGSNIDTSSAGQKVFSVASTDLAGNQTGSSVTYAVAYGICALYDQTKTHVSGSTIPVKLAICDAFGNDVSNSAIVVTANGLIEISTNASGTLDSSGSANPDNNFRFDASLGSSGGYIFNFSTRGLTTGTYALIFSVTGDPITHSVQFAIR
jgi:alpha-tubulin suppressor-like RCC1 family protein